MKAALTLICAGAVILTAACSSAIAPTPTRPPATATSPTPQTSPSVATVTPAAPSPRTEQVQRIIYRREGGIAGFRDELVIEADGAFTYYDRRRSSTSKGRISPAEYSRLAALVLQAGPAMPAEPTPYPDMLSQALTYVDSQGTLRAVDTTTIAPEFERIMASVRQN